MNGALYVRAGSIVRPGPAVQNTGERGDGSLTLHVFTARMDAFLVYEDDGVSRPLSATAPMRACRSPGNEDAHRLTNRRARRVIIGHGRTAHQFM